MSDRQIRGQSRNNARSTPLVVIICIIISVAAIIGCLAYLFVFNENTKLAIFGGKKGTGSTSDEDLKTGYVEETNYIGGIGYPEVYDFPFMKAYLTAVLLPTPSSFLNSPHRPWRMRRVL